MNEALVDTNRRRRVRMAGLRVRQALGTLRATDYFDFLRSANALGMSRCAMQREWAAYRLHIVKQRIRAARVGKQHTDERRKI